MVRTNQITAAMTAPAPNADCSKPNPFGRALSGQDSATSAMPVLHSAPIASPVKNRIAISIARLVLSAVMPVSSA
jgi:hypothetical protein